MIKHLYNKNIQKNKIIHNFISPLKYKKMNLISLNKTIKIPSFNSITSCSTNKKSYSFSLHIPKIKKRQFIPKIKKFNDSSMKSNYSRNANIMNLKSLYNEANHYNFDEKIFPLKIRLNSNRNESCINFKKKIVVKNEKSQFIFSPFKFNDLLAIHKINNIKTCRNSEIKKNLITIAVSSSNEGCIKSIFDKRNMNAKLGILKEIKKDNINRDIYLKKDKIEKYEKNIFNNNDNDDENKNKNSIINNINKLKENKEKFLKFIINNNNPDKIKNIDLLKKNIMIINQVKNKNLFHQKISRDTKLFKIQSKDNNKNKIYESLKNKFYKKYEVSNSKEDITLINKENEIYNLRKIKSIINTKGIINEYLAKRYKSNEVFFNYIKTFNTKKSNSLKLDNNLIQMSFLHINVEFEVNLNKKILEPNPDKRKIILKRHKLNDFYKIICINKRKREKIKTNKFWEKYSLLRNTSFFKNKILKKNNKQNKVINNRLKENQYFNKIIESNKNTLRNLLREEDFEKLKHLIYDKKENQFIFECYKIIDIYDINSCDKEGNTLLILACMNGDFKIVKYLLDKGANPNCINLLKKTPLHYAIANHDYNIADLLFKNGAKDDLENLNGYTPW